MGNKQSKPNANTLDCSELQVGDVLLFTGACLIQAPLTISTLDVVSMSFLACREGGQVFVQRQILQMDIVHFRRVRGAFVPAGSIFSEDCLQHRLQDKSNDSTPQRCRRCIYIISILDLIRVHLHIVVSRMQRLM